MVVFWILGYNIRFTYTNLMSYFLCGFYGCFFGFLGQNIGFIFKMTILQNVKYVLKWK